MYVMVWGQVVLGGLCKNVMVHFDKEKIEVQRLC